MEISGETLDVILGALADQLSSLADHHELVVIGGSAHFAGRLDQIHFKLFAMFDQAGGRHEADLRALHPTAEELIAAAHWSMTQDPPPGYRMVLKEALDALGVEDAVGT